MTDSMPAPLHLVACVKAKATSPSQAANLYRSPWFRKARAYVEAQGAPWYILSALHGLVARTSGHCADGRTWDRTTACLAIGPCKALTARGRRPNC